MLSWGELFDFFELQESLARWELLVALIVPLVAIFLPRVGKRFYLPLIKGLRKFGRSRFREYATIFLLPLALRLALLPFMPVPVPSVQEEFSNLLLGDTLAHGRMANPVHPMAVFFEGTQMLQHPHYVSARPLGDGFVLMAGQVLTGLPWVGVLLANGLMCCALLWMLASMVPRPWPFVGAVILGLRMSVFTLFMNSYWGQALAATGGMLVFGAVIRVRKRGWRGTSAIAGVIGMMMLASTRIFEGGLLCLALGCVLLVWYWRDLRSAALRKEQLRFAAIFAVGCVLTVGLLGYYNFRTTGNPLKPAYVLWRGKQAMAPTFIFQNIRPGKYTYFSQEDLRFYANFELGLFGFPKSSIENYLITRKDRLADFFRMYVRALLLPALLVGIFSKKTTAGWLALLALLAACAGQLILSFGMPTYQAPFLGMVYLLIILGLRRMSMAWRKSGRGPSLVTATILGIVIVFGLQVKAAIQHVNFLSEDPWYHYGYASRESNRDLILKYLAAQPGNHLVIVRYARNHPCIYEWVWNLADPDSQRIVWARELEPASTAALVRYYGGRRVWLLQVNRDEASMTPYPVESLPWPRSPESLYSSNALSLTIR